MRELKVERQRADRREIPFCLIDISMDRQNNGRSDIVRLAKALHRRLRATDIKGHRGPVTIGVILTDTEEMGGRFVLADVEAIAEDLGLIIEAELSVYDPNGWKNPSDSATAENDESLPPAPHNPVEDVPQGSIHSMVKRGIDVVGATIGLLFCAIPLLLAAAAIRLTSSGPAIFTQVREGRGGKPFKIYKLRTMYVNAEHQQAELRHRSDRDGPAFKLKNDPRVTPVGSFLRKTCIDELPQLINVLLGHMSLVGPRPLPWKESRGVKSWQRRRLDVKPGITGAWQVSKHEEVSFDDWMRLDLQYIDSNTLWGDAQLIAKTALVPVRARGNH